MSPPLTRRRNALVPAVLLGPAYWILDHSLPDLFQKQVHVVAPWLVALATIIGGVAVLDLGWRWLLGRIPRPWFPDPPWRVVRWLKQRPSLWIILAASKGTLARDTVDTCAFTLTVNRSFLSVEGSAIIDFEHARLEMTQTVDGKVRRTLFRPRETGGFLAQPTRGGGYDAVMVEFEGVAFPKAVADGPDFHGDYRLRLTGVKATLLDPKPVRGELTAVHWEWFAAFNSGGLGPGALLDQFPQGAPIQWPSV